MSPKGPFRESVTSGQRQGSNLGYAFIFALKRNEETEVKFFRFDIEKSVYFRLFCINAKHRYLKQNENEMKRKQKSAFLTHFA
jgi:hypothetical protein